MAKITLATLILFYSVSVKAYDVQEDAYQEYLKNIKIEEKAKALYKKRYSRAIESKKCSKVIARIVPKIYELEKKLKKIQKEHACQDDVFSPNCQNYITKHACHDDVFSPNCQNYITKRGEYFKSSKGEDIAKHRLRRSIQIRLGAINLALTHAINTPSCYEMHSASQTNNKNNIKTKNNTKN